MILAIALAAAASSQACDLLKAEEIAAVQRQAPSETKSSTRQEGLLQISDCVFVLPTFNKSLSLELTQGEGARRRWREIFHPRRADRSEEAERGAQPVSGVGEEAFWVARGPTSALYALRRKSFLRLSLGGPESRNVKIEKAKALMRKALRRL